MSFLGDLTPVDLELLLDVVDASSLSSDIDDSSSAQESVVEVPPHRAHKNGREQDYRRRKRDELVRLRSEAEELQLELERLQGNERCARASMRATSVVWKRVAIRQLKSRKQSERQNAQLKSALEQQLKLARQLERLFHKQARRQASLQLLDFEVCATRLLTPGRTFITMVQDGCEVSWHRVDLDLAEMGLHDISTDVDEVVVRPSVDGSPSFVEVRQARVLPFDMASTSSGVWHPDTVMPIAEAKYEVKLWSDEVIMVQCESAALVDRVAVTLEMELTVRRSQQAARIVNHFTIVYTIQSTHKAYDGVQLRGEGWYTIDATTNEDGGGPRSSIVRCVERATFCGDAPHDIHLFKGIVTEQYRAHFERMENKLMDDVVCGRVHQGSVRNDK